MVVPSISSSFFLPARDSTETVDNDEETFGESVDSDAGEMLSDLIRTGKEESCFAELSMTNPYARFQQRITYVWPTLKFSQDEGYTSIELKPSSPESSYFRFDPERDSFTNLRIKVQGPSFETRLFACNDMWRRTALHDVFVSENARITVTVNSLTRESEIDLYHRAVQPLSTGVTAGELSSIIPDDILDISENVFLVNKISFKKADE